MTPRIALFTGSRRILVPDASVGVKWYVPETHSVERARLLDPPIRLRVPFSSLLHGMSQRLAGS